MIILLTLFSALTEVSFEGAVLGPLNIFQQMWISIGKKSAKQHEFHPRGPVDAPSEDFVQHWMRRRVRLHGRVVSARVASWDERAGRMVVACEKNRCWKVTETLSQCADTAHIVICLWRHERVRGEISKIEITSRERVDVCHRSHAVSSCQFCFQSS